MNNRTIFGDMPLFKKEVTERFIIALQGIYAIHPAYPYKDNESQTKLLIGPTYANFQETSRAPQFTVRTGGYEFSLRDTLAKNMNQTIQNELGVNAGFESVKQMFFPVTVFVKSFLEEQTSDLADELASLAVYSAHHMFSQVGLNILEARVAETEETNRDKDEFQASCQFNVEVMWKFNRTDKGPANDGEVDLDFDDEIVGSYRSPGAYVFKPVNK